MAEALGIFAPAAAVPGVEEEEKGEQQIAYENLQKKEAIKIELEKSMIQERVVGLGMLG